MTTPLCTECPRPIPPHRYSTRVKTCSTDCSEERRTRRGRINARNRHRAAKGQPQDPLFDSAWLEIPDEMAEDTGRGLFTYACIMCHYRTDDIAEAAYHASTYALGHDVHPQRIGGPTPAQQAKIAAMRQTA